RPRAVNGCGSTGGFVRAARYSEEDHRIQRNRETEIDIRRRAAETDSPRHRPAAHEFFAGQHGNRTLELVRSKSAEHSDSHGVGATDTRSLCRGIRESFDWSRLLPDRTARDGPFFQ